MHSRSRKILLLFALFGVLLLTACGPGPDLVDARPTPTPSPTAIPTQKLVVTVVVQVPARVEIIPPGGSCVVKTFPKHPDYKRSDPNMPFYEWSEFNPDHVVITYSDEHGGTWKFAALSSNALTLSGLPGGLTIKVPHDGYLSVTSNPVQQYTFSDGSRLVQLGEGCNTVRSQNFVLYQTWPDP